MRSLHVLGAVFCGAMVCTRVSVVVVKEFHEQFSENGLRTIVTEEQLADDMHIFPPANRTGFGLRGKHWVKENLKLVLTANRPKIDGAGDYEILIHPVSREMTCNASKLELWVRIAGPEIFAGSAIPSSKQSCEWSFPFHLERIGEYIVESKILLYNGRADAHPKQFEYYNVNVTDKDLPMNITDRSSSRASNCIVLTPLAPKCAHVFRDVRCGHIQRLRVVQVVSSFMAKVVRTSQMHLSFDCSLAQNKGDNDDDLKKSGGLNQLLASQGRKSLHIFWVVGFPFGSRMIFHVNTPIRTT
jgi:hypothetical protein